MHPKLMDTPYAVSDKRDRTYSWSQRRTSSVVMVSCTITVQTPFSNIDHQICIYMKQVLSQHQDAFEPLNLAHWTARVQQACTTLETSRACWKETEWTTETVGH
ncbi:hypothetical protein N7532_006577 [Penicillium argentinense]|uniref:Uncharacterized protein n=1 Tax=Penicillium argentinense TaxID=1131581 RepID=A0A9W9FG72_9EURO|nr:uncharacterized protein N7532_006577 [Penicillium argentinense]KAJ5099576.1 hypothetical protein N7532_006577 [Penicillium argentinense]